MMFLTLSMSSDLKITLLLINGINRFARLFEQNPILSLPSRILMTISKNCWSKRWLNLTWKMASIHPLFPHSIFRKNWRREKSALERVVNTLHVFHLLFLLHLPSVTTSAMEIVSYYVIMTDNLFIWKYSKIKVDTPWFDLLSYFKGHDKGVIIPPIHNILLIGSTMAFSMILFSHKLFLMIEL